MLSQMVCQTETDNYGFVKYWGIMTYESQKNEKRMFKKWLWKILPVQLEKSSIAVFGDILPKLTALE